MKKNLGPFGKGVWNPRFKVKHMAYARQQCKTMLNLRNGG